MRHQCGCGRISCRDLHVVKCDRKDNRKRTPGRNSLTCRNHGPMQNGFGVCSWRKYSQDDCRHEVHQFHHRTFLEMSSSVVQGRLWRPAASASFALFVRSAALSSDVVMAFICCSRTNNIDPPIGLSTSRRPLPVSRGADILRSARLVGFVPKGDIARQLEKEDPAN